MIRAIIYGLSVYIVLMLIVSGISTLVSPKSEEPPKAYLTNVGESESEDEPTEIHDAEPSETTESPFDFSVNIITEAEEAIFNIDYTIYKFYKTEPPEELTISIINKLRISKKNRIGGDYNGQNRCGIK